MRTIRALHLMTLATLLSSCSESAFQGETGRRSVLVRNGVPNREGLPATGQTPSPGSGASPSGEGISSRQTGTSTGGTGGTQQQPSLPPTQPQQAIDPCANQNREYAVLVVDLKSGWFAGDGGDFFQSVVNSVCGNTRVKVSYIHITREKSVASVDLGSLMDCYESSSGFLFFSHTRTECSSMKDIRGFDEFWLLTGDEHDDEDLELSSPLFRSIVTRARELRAAKPNAGFFFGAGLGNIHHANALASALFPEIAGSGGSPEFGLFRPSGGQRGTLPNPDMATALPTRPLVPGSGTAPGTFDANAFPFRAFAGFGALSNLFDYQDCVSDTVAPMGTGGNTKIVATDHCGRATIAQFMVGGHKIVADANVARFYGFPDYFKRNVLLLLPGN